MKFALFGSMFPDRTVKAVEQIVGVCLAIKRHGGELILPGDFFQSLPPSVQERVVTLCEVRETLTGIDMVVSVGGDGTFLRTAETVGDLAYRCLVSIRGDHFLAAIITLTSTRRCRR